MLSRIWNATIVKYAIAIPLDSISLGDSVSTSFCDVLQDMVVTTALTSGYYRMLDYFSPNLARPRPDVVYGGTDDILDASATEAAGVTYIKFRKPLFSNDSAGDYCLYPVRPTYPLLCIVVILCTLWMRWQDEP